MDEDFEVPVQEFLNSLPHSAVILDRDGVIVACNNMWQDFARSNSLAVEECAPGINYLQTADEARGEDSDLARKASAGIKAVIRGDKDEFSLEYPCDSPEENRCFVMKVTPFSEGVLILHENTTRRQEIMNELKSKTTELENFFNLTPGLMGIADVEGNFIKVNRAWEDVLGYTPEELEGMNYLELVHPEDREKTFRALEELADTGDIKDFTNRYRGKNGSFRYIEWYAAQKGDRIYAASRDVTEQKRSRYMLNEKVKEIDCMYRVARLLGDVKKNLEDILQKAAQTIPEGWQYPEKTSVKIEYNGFSSTDDNFCKSEYFLSRSIQLTGDKSEKLTVYCSKEVAEDGSPFLEGERKLIDSLAELLGNIIQGHENYKKLKYMANHDRLTSLYNHNFFEAEMHRLDFSAKLPISIILTDINGLTLFNESLSYRVGDEILKKVAGIIKDKVRRRDVVARWGEDEFSILMPQTDSAETETVKGRIEEACEEIEIEGISLSLSLGYATKYRPEVDLHETMNEARENLDKNKLIKSESSKNKIVQSLLSALRAKSEETEEHSDRMAELSHKLGQRAGLSDAELDDLSLLANLHDIGKTTISEDLLKKPGSLNDKEWEKIKKHPRIGHNIVSTTEEFAHIAEAILHHHEHWDGQGYPEGLEGEEIPLLSRIIAIVDAYDVITNERAYKEAGSHQEAINELKKSAGSHFDPELVDEFIDIMEEEAN